jgi:MFS family permease
LPRGFAARVIGYEALQEFIPLYPLYALLFAQHGLSTGEISALFALWSATAVVAEVPSGALGDRFPRHRLLAVAAVVTGAGFAVWTVFPSFVVFAVGFVLWGLGGSVVSGTFEAYVYDTLSVHRAVRSYQRIIARSRAAGLTLNLAATLLASPLFGLGGYTAVGAVSVGACLAAAAVAATLPGDRRPGPQEAAQEAAQDAQQEAEHEAEQDLDQAGYLELLRTGTREAARSVPVRHAVLLAALLPAFLIFDEYFPLLGRDLGAATSVVPLLIALTVAAQAGGALAGERCTPAQVPAALVIAAVLLAIGALSGHPAGFAAIAAGYGLMQMTIVVAETHLQASITGSARATVTSVSGLLGELLSIGLFAGIAVGSAALSLVTLICLLAAAIVPVAWLSRRWLTRGAGRFGPSPDTEG